MPRLTLFATAFAACALAPRVAAADTDRCVSSAEQVQIQRRDGHLRAARDEAISCASEACPEPVRGDCKRWLGEIDVELPTVVFRAVDGSGRDVLDARVLCDGAPLVERIEGRPVALDPGEHVLRWVRASGASLEERVVVRQGEHDRIVSATFASPRETLPSRPVSPAVWLLGGVSLAAIGAGVFLWVRGLSDRSDLYATCGHTESCDEAAVDSAKTKILVGDVLVGAGLAAAGVATWIALTSRDRAPSVRLGARAVPGGGVLDGQLHF